MVELDISANSVQLDCSVDSGICVEGVTKDLKKKIQEFKRILFILERDKEAMRLLRERLSRIAERKIVKKKKDGQSVCNVCFTQIDTDDSKTCIACCSCAKNVCRGEKCSEWVPNDGEWRCQLCAARRDSYGKASTWVQEQYAVKKASLTEFSYPMRARSEIYIPLCDPNESAFLCNFESVSEVPSPINPNQKQHIREYIEEVLADMIGGSLKNATVEPISTNNMDYQQVRNGNELQGISNVRLRRLIESVIAETIRQPPFASAGLITTTTTAIDSNDIDNRENLPLNGNHCNGNGGQYFESKKYHDLLATAVLNKIVNTHGNGRHSESSPDLTSSSILDNNHNTLNLNKTDESISSSSSVEPRSESSLTDPIRSTNKDDPISNYGNFYDDVANDNIEADRESVLSDFISSHMVPLPHISADPASEEDEDEEDFISVTSSRDANWEDNWLFKKKKSNKTSASVGMLVPAPKEDIRALIGDKPTDEVSDLSEVGSDTDDSSLEMISASLEPLNDRLVNKHLIGGKNTKIVLDEIVDRTSMISTSSLPDNVPPYTETKNEFVVSNDGLNECETLKISVNNCNKAISNEAINSNVTKTISTKADKLAKENQVTEDESIVPPPNDFTDDEKMRNLLAKFNEEQNNKTDSGDDNSSSLSPRSSISCALSAGIDRAELDAYEGITDFCVEDEEGLASEIESSSRRPSVIEILAAIALGPMLAVSASDDRNILTEIELSSLMELNELAMAQLNAKANEERRLGVIAEESFDGGPGDDRKIEVIEGNEEADLLSSPKMVMEAIRDLVGKDAFKSETSQGSSIKIEEITEESDLEIECNLQKMTYDTEQLKNNHTISSKNEEDVEKDILEKTCHENTEENNTNAEMGKKNTEEILSNDPPDAIKKNEEQTNQETLEVEATFEIVSGGEEIKEDMIKKEITEDEPREEFQQEQSEMKNETENQVIQKLKLSENALEEAQISEIKPIEGFISHDEDNGITMNSISEDLGFEKVIPEDTSSISDESLHTIGSSSEYSEDPEGDATSFFIDDQNISVTAELSDDQKLQQFKEEIPETQPIIEIKSIKENDKTVNEFILPPPTAFCDEQLRKLNEDVGINETVQLTEAHINAETVQTETQIFSENSNNEQETTVTEKETHTENLCTDIKNESEVKNNTNTFRTSLTKEMTTSKEVLLQSKMSEEPPDKQSIEDILPKAEVESFEKISSTEPLQNQSVHHSEIEAENEKLDDSLKVMEDEAVKIAENLAGKKGEQESEIIVEEQAASSVLNEPDSLKVLSEAQLTLQEVSSGKSSEEEVSIVNPNEEQNINLNPEEVIKIKTNPEILKLEGSQTNEEANNNTPPSENPPNDKLFENNSLKHQVDEISGVQSIEETSNNKVKILKEKTSDNIGEGLDDNPTSELRHEETSNQQELEESGIEKPPETLTTESTTNENIEALEDDTVKKEIEDNPVTDRLSSEKKCSETCEDLRTEVKNLNVDLSSDSESIKESAEDQSANVHISSEKPITEISSDLLLNDKQKIDFPKKVSGDSVEEKSQLELPNLTEKNIDTGSCDDQTKSIEGTQIEESTLVSENVAASEQNLNDLQTETIPSENIIEVCSKELNPKQADAELNTESLKDDIKIQTISTEHEVEVFDNDVVVEENLTPEKLSEELSKQCLEGPDSEIVFGTQDIQVEMEQETPESITGYKIKIIPQSEQVSPNFDKVALVSSELSEDVKIEAISNVIPKEEFPKKQEGIEAVEVPKTEEKNCELIQQAISKQSSEVLDDEKKTETENQTLHSNKDEIMSVSENTTEFALTEEADAELDKTEIKAKQTCESSEIENMLAEPLGNVAKKVEEHVMLAESQINGESISEAKEAKSEENSSQIQMENTLVTCLTAEKLDEIPKNTQEATEISEPTEKIKTECSPSLNESTNIEQKTLNQQDDTDSKNLTETGASNQTEEVKEKTVMVTLDESSAINALAAENNLKEQQQQNTQISDSKTGEENKIDGDEQVEIEKTKQTEVDKASENQEDIKKDSNDENLNNQENTSIEASSADQVTESLNEVMPMAERAGNDVDSSILVQRNEEKLEQEEQNKITEESIKLLNESLINKETSIQPILPLSEKITESKETTESVSETCADHEEKSQKDPDELKEVQQNEISETSKVEKEEKEETQVIGTKEACIEPDFGQFEKSLNGLENQSKTDNEILCETINSEKITDKSTEKALTPPSLTVPSLDIDPSETATESISSEEVQVGGLKIEKEIPNDDNELIEDIEGSKLKEAPTSEEQTENAVIEKAEQNEYQTNKDVNQSVDQNQEAIFQAETVKLNVGDTQLDEISLNQSLSTTAENIPENSKTEEILVVAENETILNDNVDKTSGGNSEVGKTVVEQSCDPTQPELENSNQLISAGTNSGKISEIPICQVEDAKKDKSNVEITESSTTDIDANETKVEIQKSETEPREENTEDLPVKTKTSEETIELIAEDQSEMEKSGTTKMTVTTIQQETSETIEPVTEVQSEIEKSGTTEMATETVTTTQQETSETIQPVTEVQSEIEKSGSTEMTTETVTTTQQETSETIEPVNEVQSEIEKSGTTEMTTETVTTTQQETSETIEAVTEVQSEIEKSGTTEMATETVTTTQQETSETIQPVTEVQSEIEKSGTTEMTTETVTTTQQETSETIQPVTEVQSEIEKSGSTEMTTETVTTTQQETSETIEPVNEVQSEIEKSETTEMATETVTTTQQETSETIEPVTEVQSEIEKSETTEMATKTVTTTQQETSETIQPVTEVQSEIEKSGSTEMTTETVTTTQQETSETIEPVTEVQSEIEKSGSTEMTTETVTTTQQETSETIEPVNEVQSEIEKSGTTEMTTETVTTTQQETSETIQTVTEVQSEIEKFESTEMTVNEVQCEIEKSGTTEMTTQKVTTTQQETSETIEPVNEVQSEIEKSGTTEMTTETVTTTQQETSETIQTVTEVQSEIEKSGTTEMTTETVTTTQQETSETIEPVNEVQSEIEKSGTTKMTTETVTTTQQETSETIEPVNEVQSDIEKSGTAEMTTETVTTTQQETSETIEPVTEVQSEIEKSGTTEMTTETVTTTQQETSETIEPVNEVQCEIEKSGTTEMTTETVTTTQQETSETIEPVNEVQSDIEKSGTAEMTTETVTTTQQETSETIEPVTEVQSEIEKSGTTEMTTETVTTTQQETSGNVICEKPETELVCKIRETEQTVPEELNEISITKSEQLDKITKTDELEHDVKTLMSDEPIPTEDTSEELVKLKPEKIHSANEVPAGNDEQTEIHLENQEEPSLLAETIGEKVLESEIVSSILTVEEEIKEQKEIEVLKNIADELKSKDSSPTDDTVLSEEIVFTKEELKKEILTEVGNDTEKSSQGQAPESQDKALPPELLVQQETLTDRENVHEEEKSEDAITNCEETLKPTQKSEGSEFKEITPKEIIAEETSLVSPIDSNEASLPTEMMAKVEETNSKSTLSVQNTEEILKDDITVDKMELSIHEELISEVTNKIKSEEVCVVEESSKEDILDNLAAKPDTENIKDAPITKLEVQNSDKEVNPEAQETTLDVNNLNSKTDDEKIGSTFNESDLNLKTDDEKIGKMPVIEHTMIEDVIEKQKTEIMPSTISNTNQSVLETESTPLENLYIAVKETTSNENLDSSETSTREFDNQTTISNELESQKPTENIEEPTIKVKSADSEIVLTSAEISEKNIDESLNTYSEKINEDNADEGSSPFISSEDVPAAEIIQPEEDAKASKSDESASISEVTQLISQKLQLDDIVEVKAVLYEASEIPNADIESKGIPVPKEKLLEEKAIAENDKISLKKGDNLQSEEIAEVENSEELNLDSKTEPNSLEKLVVKEPCESDITSAQQIVEVINTSCCSEIIPEVEQDLTKEEVSIDQPVETEEPKLQESLKVIENILSDETTTFCDELINEKDESTKTEESIKEPGVTAISEDPAISENEVPTAEASKTEKITTKMEETLVSAEMVDTNEKTIIDGTASGETNVGSLLQEVSNHSNDKTEIEEVVETEEISLSKSNQLIEPTEAPISDELGSNLKESHNETQSVSADEETNIELSNLQDSETTEKEKPVEIVLAKDSEDINIPSEKQIDQTSLTSSGDIQKETKPIEQTAVEAFDTKENLSGKMIESQEDEEQLTDIKDETKQTDTVQTKEAVPAKEVNEASEEIQSQNVSNVEVIPPDQTDELSISQDHILDTKDAKEEFSSIKTAAGVTETQNDEDTDSEGSFMSAVEDEVYTENISSIDPRPSEKQTESTSLQESEASEDVAAKESAEVKEMPVEVMNHASELTHNETIVSEGITLKSQKPEKSNEESKPLELSTDSKDITASAVEGVRSKENAITDEKLTNVMDTPKFEGLLTTLSDDQKKIDVSEIHEYVDSQKSCINAIDEKAPVESENIEKSSNIEAIRTEDPIDLLPDSRDTQVKTEGMQNQETTVIEEMPPDIIADKSQTQILTENSKCISETETANEVLSNATDIMLDISKSQDIISNDKNVSVHSKLGTDADDVLKSVEVNQTEAIEGSEAVKLKPQNIPETVKEVQIEQIESIQVETVIEDSNIQKPIEDTLVLLEEEQANIEEKTDNIVESKNEVESVSTEELPFSPKEMHEEVTDAENIQTRNDTVHKNILTELKTPQDPTGSLNVNSKSSEIGEVPNKTITNSSLEKIIDKNEMITEKVDKQKSQDGTVVTEAVKEENYSSDEAKLAEESQDYSKDAPTMAEELQAAKTSIVKSFLTELVAEPSISSKILPTDDTLELKCTVQRESQEKSSGEASQEISETETLQEESNTISAETTTVESTIPIQYIDGAQTSSEVISTTEIPEPKKVDEVEQTQTQKPSNSSKEQTPKSNSADVAMAEDKLSEAITEQVSEVEEIPPIEVLTATCKIITHPPLQPTESLIESAQYLYDKISYPVLETTRDISAPNLAEELRMAADRNDNKDASKTERVIPQSIACESRCFTPDPQPDQTIASYSVATEQPNAQDAAQGNHMSQIVKQHLFAQQSARKTKPKNSGSKFRNLTLRDRRFLAELEKRRKQRELIQNYLDSLDSTDTPSYLNEDLYLFESKCSIERSPYSLFIEPSDYCIVDATSTSQTAKTHFLKANILFSDRISSDSNLTDDSTTTVIDTFGSMESQSNSDSGEEFSPDGSTDRDSSATATATATTANNSIITTNKATNQSHIYSPPPQPQPVLRTESACSKLLETRTTGGNEEHVDDDPLKHLVPGSIAEREYKKWYNAVDMPNNPYSAEALRRRLSGGADRALDLPNISPCIEESPLQLCESPTTEADSKAHERDYSRYSRDYYINDAKQASGTTKKSPTSPPQVSSPTSTASSIELGERVEYNSKTVGTTPVIEMCHKLEKQCRVEADIYLATPVHVIEDIPEAFANKNPIQTVGTITSLTSEAVSKISSETSSTLTNESLTPSEDSDTIRIYDLKKQETRLIKETTQTTTITVPKSPEKKVRPTELDIMPTLAPPIATVSSKCSTPTSFKFLQPKRKLINPSQVLSIDLDTAPITPCTPEKTVIEAEVAHAMPSVKALAKAFLLTTSTSSSENKWRKVSVLNRLQGPEAGISDSFVKARAKSPLQFFKTTTSTATTATTAANISKVIQKQQEPLIPDTTSQGSEDATIASDLSSLETDPPSRIDGETLDSNSSEDRAASPVVLSGCLRNNIAFFENLKNK